jgi:hypothetical protein
MPATVPIYDPQRGFKTWHINEIYTGPNGSGAYVPNVNDLVIDWARGLLRVSAVDITTGLSTLVDHVFPSANDISNSDVLFGVGPGYTSELWRLYVNRNVVPHTLSINSSLVIYDPASSYCKIFKGTNTSATGIVISANYNNAGDYVSENIPLIDITVPVDSENGISANAKVPGVGYTNEALNDNDLVTLVIYTAAGNVTGRYKLQVSNTSFIRSLEANTRYISDIVIESPFISENDSRVIEVPLNVPLSSVVARARVFYTDGTSRAVTIDGTKCSLYGFENYVATISGQRIPLVLNYKLGANEFSTISQGGAERAISKPYDVRTIDVVGGYSVKLFPIPTWNVTTEAWDLTYLLYTLDRGEWFNATPFIEVGANSQAYNGRSWSNTQWLTVALDIEKVDPRLTTFRHVQRFGISLLRNGLSPDDSWTLHFNDSGVPYGAGISCQADFISVGHWSLNIACGKTALEDWLDALYYRVEPLFDVQNESRAPAPTHFVLNINGIRNEYPIASWNIAIPSTTGSLAGTSAVIEWRRRVSAETLELGATPIKIVHDF